MMLRETVEHLLAHDLVRDSAEEPFDDRLGRCRSVTRRSWSAAGEKQRAQ